MKFSELLVLAIGKAEIPLRFEPGAAESVAKPVTELLKAWVQAHAPELPSTDFELGQKALVNQLVAELEDRMEVPE